MKTKLFLVTPPFTQLNTPYPATAYIKGFLNTKNIESVQADLRFGSYCCFWLVLFFVFKFRKYDFSCSLFVFRHGFNGIYLWTHWNFLSELFPTTVRYSGASLTFNLAGIIGAAFAPMIAIWIVSNYGLDFVGYYLSAAAVISVISLLVISKKEHQF